MLQAKKMIYSCHDATSKSEAHLAAQAGKSIIAQTASMAYTHFHAYGATAIAYNYLDV